jgi:hypothetical protein
MQRRPFHHSKLSALVNDAMDGRNLIQSLDCKAQSALIFPERSLENELEVYVQVVPDCQAIDFENRRFKQLYVYITPDRFRYRGTLCGLFHSTGDLIEVAGQIVYALVRVWAGQYLYCPIDQACHKQLYDIALIQIEDECSTSLSSEDQDLIAEIIVTFFEKTFVTYILTSQEGACIARGLVHKHKLVEQKCSLISELFFLCQSYLNPLVWSPEIQNISMGQEPLISALVSNVIRIIFGIPGLTGDIFMKVPPVRLPMYEEWPDCVAELARLLIPWLIDEAQDNQTGQNDDYRPDQPNAGGGQTESPSEHLKKILKNMNNPFAGSGDSEDEPTGQGPSYPPGLLAGTKEAQIPPRNINDLDDYYQKRAPRISLVNDSSDNKKKAPPPEVDTLAFLDSEPTSMLSLITDPIDYFRSRVIEQNNGQKKLQLYKRTCPLEAPISREDPAPQGVKNLLFLVDSSSSMGFNPTKETNRGKYDIVLLSIYGILEHIQRNALGGSMQLTVINFSSKTLESGWCKYQEAIRKNPISKFKNTLLTYQHGGTVLDPKSLNNTFETRPGKFLAILVTDGQVAHTEKIIPEFKKIVSSDCQLAMFHIGDDTILSIAMKNLGCPVWLLKDPKDLIGLSLQVAKNKLIPSKAR